MSISRFLATADLFADLPPELYETVGVDMAVVEIHAEEVLFEVGDRGDAVYFVLQGSVHLESDGVVIARRGEGECVGEFALVDQAPRSASARARAASRLIRWPRAAFSRALSDHPGLAAGLFRLLTTKLREDVEARVKHAVDRERWHLEMELAREVQQGLLPPPEAVLDGLDISCVCEPAGHVGGDLYDYVVIDDVDGSGLRGIGVLIGDVTGHGVHSALLAAMAKSCFRNQLRVDVRPAAVMHALSHTLELCVGQRLLMSAAYAFISERQVIYANAGHPPILHVHQGESRVTRLGALDPILGVVSAASFTANEERRALHAGDLLVLHTDGITEARNAAGEQYGAGRLDAVLGDEPYRWARDCKLAVLESVSAFAQDRQIDDDITLVAVRAS